MPPKNIVRNIQDFHVQKRFDHAPSYDDIGYNFLIAHDGTVFVGRGWLYEGTHSRDYDKGSICIAFIGNFNKELPTDESLDAAQRLIQMGVNIGRLDRDYHVYAHCQVILTEHFGKSPGFHLFDAIRNWDHFSMQVRPPKNLSTTFD